MPKNYDKIHNNNMDIYAKKIESIYTTAAKEGVNIAMLVGSFKEGKPFSFADYPITKDRVDKLFKSLSKNIESTLLNGIDHEWTLSNNKNNELSRRVFGDSIGKLSKEQEQRYFNNNHKARDAFKLRQESGLKLSDRVWNYTNQFKAEIETGIDFGIRDRLSAQEMKGDLLKYLKDPDRYYRRFKYKTGENPNGSPIYGKKWKRRVYDEATEKYKWVDEDIMAYNPGRGVYRSSIRNAQRVARTETNMAYRASDHARWQQFDFVVGIEVRRSNHGFDCPLCNGLAGKYPKDFKFIGWHPNCRCHAISILKTPEEMAADNERVMNGEPLTNDSVNKVTQVNDSFSNWAEANKHRFGKKNTPYFVRDNFVDGDINKGLSFANKASVKRVKTDAEKVAIQERWDERKEVNKITKEKAIKGANNLLEYANTLSDLNTTPLTQALKSDNVNAIKATTSSLAKEANIATKKAKALYKEQPTEWGLTKEFGKESSDAFVAAWNKYTDKKAHLTDSEYLKVIEKEIFYGKKNVGKYATSEKMIYFLEKEKERILVTIEKKQIVEGVSDVLKFSQTTKSSTMNKLASEWDSLVSSGATNVQLKAKATALQNHYIKLEQDRIKRMAKKASNTGVDDISFFDANHNANESINWTKGEKDMIDVLRFKYKESLIKHNNNYRNTSVLDAQNTLAENLRRLSMKYVDKRATLSHIDGVTDKQIKEALSRYLKTKKVGSNYYSSGIGGAFKGSYSSAYKQLSQDLKAKGINMTVDEISLIGRYTDGSGFINGYLSGKDSSLSWSGLLDDYRTAINGALEKMPRYNGITYRGMSSYASSTIKEFQDCLKTGSSYVEKCVMSTSTNIQRSDCFDGFVMIKIYGRTGADCKMISSFNTEDEIIFRSGSKFKVLSIEKQSNSLGIGKNDDIWVVELEDINS